MITEQRGNLIQAPAEALVNTVNTVGVMGKGIALQFKRAFPDNFKLYERACKRGDVELGRMFVVPVDGLTTPRYIINFPTKSHWRARSRLADIRTGLDDLVRVVTELNLTSVAVPPLGCGNGGLDWNDVYPLIRQASERIPNTHLLVYPPAGAPSASEMPNRTKRPEMTYRRAGMILAFDRYVRMSFTAGHSFDGSFSLVEAQKVAYFLQLAGWPSDFEFTPGHFGPYSQTVEQWLSLVEGHFITGYGDGTSGSKAVLHVKEDAVADAQALMASSGDFDAILDRFEALVYGFEFPYGIELLSTVHYIVSREPERAKSVESVVEGIERWSRRKRQLFRPRQAQVAFDHLSHVGALGS